MPRRSTSQIDRHGQSGKPTMHQHLASGNHRHSTSMNKDKDSRRNESSFKQREKTAILQKGGGNNHIAKSSNERTKHHKVQSALRSCGNWSEHVSSSGKKYFYNNISEVSQWEKPKDWNDSSAVDLKSRDKGKSSLQRTGNVRPNKSTISTSGKNQTSSHSSVTSDKDYRNRNKDFCDRDYRTKGGATGDHDYRDVDYRDVSSVRNIDNKDLLQRSLSTDKDYRSMTASHSNEAMHLPAPILACTSGSNGHELSKENYVPSTGEFYDYSKWDEKTSSDASVVNGLTGSHETLDKLSNSANQLKDEALSTISISTSSEAKTTETAATAFVRKLSTVLTQAASTSNENINEPNGNLKNMFQLLLNAAATHNNTSAAEVTDGAEAKLEVASSNDPPPVKRHCAAADEKRDFDDAQSVMNSKIVQDPVPQVSCLESLRDLFDPSSIAHVRNWSSEHSELQCQHFSDDFHRFVVKNLSDLSAQLTHARSEVRASEILSTLQEQRILYIRQLITDLDKSVSTSGPLT